MKNCFPQNLRKLRKAHKMTQIEFAESLLVNSVAISNYENGKSFPYIDVIIRIKTIYNTNFDDMIFKELNYEAFT